MKKLIPLFAAAALVLVPLQDAQAQVGVEFGPELAYNTEAEGLALGARLGLSPAVFPLGFVVNGLYHFEGCDPFDCTVLEFGASAKYDISLPGSPIAPYIGGGVTHQRLSSDDIGDADDTGFHVMGGIGLGGVMPVGAFAELRYHLMNDFENQLAISVGILF